ncbi:PREDICTED: uncharacterized protein LOC109487144 [Branchiostoma belcheri]|uniref:Uncharacterized protein LOC109487144 n=1 Tax=Branchiostoma belcheri TaxID=7741 RepID=A0A6P5A012_BRABE|nr:PREDICTED: uncharacterized protein LOC109487144 [Branchiostoma belcheri]
MRFVLLLSTLVVGVCLVQARPKAAACRAILSEVKNGRWKDMPQDIIDDCRQALQSTRHGHHHKDTVGDQPGEPLPPGFVLEPPLDGESTDYVKTTRKFIRTLINALSGLSVNLKHMKATQRQADLKRGKPWKP